MYLGDTGLLPGESLLWEGTPRNVPIVEKSDLVLVPGLLFLGFFFYPANRAPMSMVAYAIPTVIVLLWSGQGPPQLAERADGTGTITFGGGFAAGFLGGTRNRDAESALPRLVGIEEARRVRDLIASAQHPGR
ncbi:hypothetical protein GCM10027598_22440 [Amycolatopsis oliviviridis]|uniref:Uncharacterized protein n=1 Tax=Amycolatopsis oliviviridis TaxID=1471590 RepID=A0ABQ3LHC2_9PSEU|nr:hypothetical protein [Amycolatopsis oliviviridis]GHH15497.1 hypothetical protein GCM10017790_30080 [Amycolatopsis oliviviridis]